MILPDGSVSRLQAAKSGFYQWTPYYGVPAERCIGQMGFEISSIYYQKTDLL